ncbi:MAG: PH domain-containing protein [Methanomassiliicoccaceae archaeon]|nr:PH domain-containing protein [Methanomassiliicoccaceae archaeon]
MNKTMLAIVLTSVITIGTVAGVILLINSGSVSVSPEDDGLRINAPMTNVYIAYGDIDSVEFREEFNAGSRTNGFGGSNISSGKFRNAEFGDYTLARYKGVDAFIVIHTGGRVVVFNQDSVDRTVEIYNELLTRI